MSQVPLSGLCNRFEHHVATMHAARQPFDVAHLLDRAIDLHRAGNLASAQLLYVQILGVSPQHFDALHLLGVLRHQQGRNEEAYVLIAAAHRINPDSVEALSNLGIVLQELGRNEEAVATYDRVLAMQPRYVEALNNRGIALRALNRPAAAVMSFDRAIALRPDYVEAHFNRADLLASLRRFEDAVESFDRAIALQPGHFESRRGRGQALLTLGHYDAALASLSEAVTSRPDDLDMRFARGTALSGLSRHEEAIGEYDKVLEREPDHVAALVSRGDALMALDRFGEADATFRKAIALRPDDAGIRVGLGNALLRNGRYAEAVTSYDHALRLRPRDVDALHGRGKALQGLQRWRDALAAYDQAVAVAPSHIDALSNRGAVLGELGMHRQAIESLDQAIALAPDVAEARCHRGNALMAIGRFADALDDYIKAIAIDAAAPGAFSGYAACAARICDWSRTAQIQAAIGLPGMERKSLMSPQVLLRYQASPAQQVTCARNYRQTWWPTPTAIRIDGARRDHAKLRIGYLSANFHRETASASIADLLERHDRSRFETIGISFGPRADGETGGRAIAACDAFHDMREASDFDIAEHLNRLEIDIAVDLMGYATGARPGILAHRPAPLQVRYLGYPGTMGSEAIDYIIADPIVVPADEDAFYAEKVVRLPDCHQVYDSRRAIAETVPGRKEAGLPEQGFVFCCFNRSDKITAPVFDVWMRLLKATTGSVLWLRDDNEAAERNLRHQAAAREVDPARLIFATRVDPDTHLARHRLADLFLDTLPYNAGTASGDALWAGLPVLTCRGNTFAGRLAASQLLAIGLPELITSSLEDYAVLAQWLAEDTALLGEIRKRLAENRQSHPLFETDLTRRHVEAAYTMMWQLWQRGERPRGFRIEACDGVDSPVPDIAVAR